MLNAIDKKFGKVAGLWEKLVNHSITFYFLPIKDMGLTDELYIKMNSRGKPLTTFENFKAELEREIKKLEKLQVERVRAEQRSRELQISVEDYQRIVQAVSKRSVYVLSRRR